MTADRAEALVSHHITHHDLVCACGAFLSWWVAPLGPHQDPLGDQLLYLVILGSLFDVSVRCRLDLSFFGRLALDFIPFAVRARTPIVSLRHDLSGVEGLTAVRVIGHVQCVVLN